MSPDWQQSVLIRNRFLHVLLTNSSLSFQVYCISSAQLWIQFSTTYYPESTDRPLSGRCVVVVSIWRAFLHFISWKPSSTFDRQKTAILTAVCATCTQRSQYWWLLTITITTTENRRSFPENASQVQKRHISNWLQKVDLASHRVVPVAVMRTQTDVYITIVDTKCRVAVDIARVLIHSSVASTCLVLLTTFIIVTRNRNVQSGEPETQNGYQWLHSTAPVSAGTGE